jgi:hypothetical protein
MSASIARVAAKQRLMIKSFLDRGAGEQPLTIKRLSRQFEGLIDMTVKPCPGPARESAASNSPART